MDKETLESVGRRPMYVIGRQGFGMCIFGDDCDISIRPFTRFSSAEANASMGATKEVNNYTIYELKPVAIVSRKPVETETTMYAGQEDKHEEKE